MQKVEHPSNIFQLFVVDAIYTDQILPEYGGNPLIEALPPILNEDQVVHYCSVFPEYNERERELDASYRYHCVQRLFQYFQPFEDHLNLEQKISCSIRQGYIPRNPLNTDWIKWMQESYESIKKGKFLEEYQTQTKKTAMGFTIIGFSGVGKSSALERILSFYPKLIQHTTYRGEMFHRIQIPYMKLDCPFDGSIKGLCLSFFAELDRLLGTNHFNKYKGKDNTTDVILQHMVHLANLYSLGLLVIDEIQHLSPIKSRGSNTMLNFFVTLVNTIGLPVVLVGTNKAVPTLQSQFRQARRGSGGQGDMIWSQIPKDEAWDLFVEGMWEYQWTKKFTALTQEISELLYEESQGIIDIAVKIFMISQLRAISSGTEKITKRLIEQVAKENLRLVRPMLQALKSGIPSEIAKYDDIQPIDMDEQFERYKASIDLNEKVRLRKKIQESKRLATENSLLEELVLFLLSMDIDTKVSHRIADKIIKQHGEKIDLPTAKKEAMRLVLISEEEMVSQKNETDTQDDISSNVLCLLVAEAKKKKLSVYEHFDKHGFIKGPLESIS